MTYYMYYYCVPSHTTDLPEIYSTLLLQRYTDSDNVTLHVELAYERFGLLGRRTLPQQRSISRQ